MQTETARAKYARESALRKLVERFKSEGLALEPPQWEAFLAAGEIILPELHLAHSVLFSENLHDDLDLGQSLSGICADGAALIEPISESGEPWNSAYRTYAAGAEMLAAVYSEPLNVAALLRAGVSVGDARLRLRQVTSGLWDMFLAAEETAQIATSEAKRRERGGHRRGAELKRQAEEWKARLLPVARELDRAHPEWNRQKLAMEIIFQTDEGAIGLRSVEDWLRLEVEPTGLIGSRSRKQIAKQPSQDS